MYTQRKFPLLVILKLSQNKIYFFLLLSIVPVFFYTVLKWHWLHLPWLPIGLVGTAVAFVIGFKNNATYGRLWEARKVLGGIVNVSRSFTIMINDFIDMNDLSKSEVSVIKKDLVYRHVAWMTSLRHALRKKKKWEFVSLVSHGGKHSTLFEIRERKYTLEQELGGYLSDEEMNYVLSKTNKQAACLNLQSKKIKELVTKKYIDGLRHIEIQNLLVEMFTLQGKLERIKNFPYPRQYATLNYYFVWIFIFLLPFGIMHEFDKIGTSILSTVTQYKPYPVGGYEFLVEIIGANFVWLSIPFSTIISWIFQTMERVGETSENPFEGTPNDVPITTITRSIEIDMREMIGEDPLDIPEPIPEVRSVQF